MERHLLNEKRRPRAGRRACLFACLFACLALPSQAQYVFYNADTARIETTNSFWVGTGLLGGDGGLSIGYAGAASPAGGAIFAANVGIGDSSPASLFTVGAGDKFRVDAAGNLIRINNIAYSWPAAQGGVSTFLQNDGAGNLTWALTPGDNLGNHLATQNLNLNTFNIFGVGSITANAAITTYSSMTVAGNGGTYGLIVSSNITAAAGLFNTANGKVGVGTAAPGYGLEVISPTGVYFSTAATANDGVYFSPKGMLAVGGKNAWDQDPKARLHIVSTGTYNGTYLLMSKYRDWGGTGVAAVKFYDSGDAALMEIGYTGLTTGRMRLNGGASAMGASIELYNHAGVATVGLVSNGNTYFNGGGVSIGTAGTARGKLDVYGIDSEIFVGNNAGQAGIIGNSRRLNYGDVLLARNLQGTSGSDAYRTKDATTGGGYAGVELKHSGDVAIYGQNGNTTAGAAVTPTPRLFIKGDSGAVGLGRTAPNAALDVVSTGTASNVYAQIWRASDGTVVSSVSATGMLTVKDSAHFATAAGNVGIGTNSPGAKFTIGNNQFQVNATGNLVKVNNIAYSWPGAQGAVNSVLKNDGAGNLTWAGLSSDNLGNHTATQDLNMAGFDITGAGYFEGSLYRRDLRTIAPSDETSGTMRFGFTAWGNNGAPPYADFLHLRSYTDGTGGKDNLLMLRRDAIGLRLWQQDWNSATPYAAYKDMAFTDGTNAAGTWGISITGDADTLDLLHKTSFGASLDTSGNNVRLLNSDGTQLASITPPYATNSDTLDLLHKTSFGASLDTSGNNVRLLNSDGTQLASITPPYATNSDTVDSLHATDFLRKVAAIDGNTQPDSLLSGQYWSPIYSNNYLTPYGHLLTLKGGTGASVTQLAMGWPGSDGGDSGLWVRGRRDTGSNIWGTWSKIWSDRNDGSGSTLDADQLDGLHKTSFGASLDTSGNNVRLLNSDGTQLTSITPPYATNADTVDTLHAHAGTNNEANKLVRTDGSGYIQAGWINTPSGDAGTNAIDKIYGTYASDSYVRYYTLANLASQVRGLAAWNAAVANDYPVAQVLRWKNYGVNHVIFDASNGTAPDGTAHNNTNPEVAWAASYPTLMGYNGTNTYGVRVSNAGYADTAGNADTLDALHKTSFGASVDTSGNNIRLLNSDGTQLSSITPPYATSAGNADTVDSLHASAFFQYPGWVASPGYDANTIAGNRSGFTYSNNAPWTGPMAHLDAGGYGLQFNASYSGGGDGLSFRTRNGDAGTWNGWNTIIHSDNIGSQSVNYAASAGNADTVDGYHLNQDVRTSAGPTFADVYTSGWFRNNNANQGIYNTSTGRHFYSQDASYWAMASGNGMVLRDTHAGTITGYLYWDGTAGSNNFGLLSPSGGWRVRVDNSNTELYGGVYAPTIYADNDYMRSNTAYGRIGANFYGDTINTGVAGDPLELNNYRSGDVRFVGGDQTMALNRLVYPGSVSGLSDYQKSYYLASHASWGLYTNTSFNSAGGLYDVGSRVAISRAEGRNFVDYSRYVYNNGAYSGSGWVEPSDLGVRYAASAGSVSNADTVDSLHSSAFLRAGTQSPAGNAELAQSANSSSYSEAAIELRELNYGGAQTGAIGEAPRISFHWGGRVASQIVMPTDGSIQIRNNPGTGYEVLRAANIYSNDNLVAYAGGSNASGTWPISISGYSENVTTPAGTYKHLGIWGGGRTDAGAILVNTSYRADIADTLDGYDSSAFLRKEFYSRGCIGGNGLGGNCTPLSCNPGDQDIGSDCRETANDNKYCERLCCRGSD